MPDNSKLPLLPELDAIADDDLMYVVDVSDETDDPSGSSKFITWSYLYTTLLAMVVSGVPGGTEDNIVTIAADESLQDSGIAIIDEDDMSSDSASAVPTQQSVKAYVDANAGAGGASFWNPMPDTVTRTDDDTITIPDTGNALLLDQIFKKGTLIKWTDTGDGWKIAMVKSSSYSSNVVTIELIGNAFEADFADVMFCSQLAPYQDFLIAGNFPSSATTNVSRSWYNPMDIYPLDIDLYVDTQGTGSGNNTVDVNDDGTTIITTKPSVAASTGSDLDNITDKVTGDTVSSIAAGSKITVDVDAVTATTPAGDACVRLWYMPVGWRYR